MKFQLRVSKVLVTGGSSGIGLAIAKLLLAEGCHVCICGRDIEKLNKVKAEAEENNDRLSILQWDIQDIQIAEEKFNEAAVLCGGYLDGLINNAGIYISQTGWKAWHETEEQWDSVWGINLKSQIFLLRKFATYLNNNKRKGNIFVVSSITCKNITIEGSYYGSKFALSRMVRSHAKKVAQFGIVINGINPGIVGPTGINKSSGELKAQAIGRYISPNEIAQISMFMMSEQAEALIGSMLDADGGFFHAM